MPSAESHHGLYTWKLGGKGIEDLACDVEWSGLSNTIVNNPFGFLYIVTGALEKDGNGSYGTTGTLDPNGVMTIYPYAASRDANMRYFDTSLTVEIAEATRKALDPGEYSGLITFTFSARNSNPAE